MLYKEKWQSLRQVPPSTPSSTSQSSSSSAPPSAPAARSQARTGGRRLKRLQYLASKYFASQPGANNAAPNVGLHYCLKQVLKGASYPKEKVQELTEITAYRLGAIYKADYLREQIGLEFPSIFDTDPNQAIGKIDDNALITKT
ncbi:hypothetical protein ACN38_g12769 [Penicillium nordicum]|uniref:Uncharacterized protein n=1 Tax=Penicillium nordicum TaxID=229535 RepID=A0A0M9W9K2_9EURO|nr:hypothetical protein ACN38_g12769 [Penicillium nordicum]